MPRKRRVARPVASKPRKGPTGRGAASADPGALQRVLAIVEWLDSSSGPDGWRALGDLDADAVPCRSVGWLVEETKSALVLVPHISGGGRVRQFGKGDIAIPKASVVRWRVLRV